ncbi:hypothetical protein ACLQ29_30950 [Micromonospora sp. DT228]|uniref:hypothetical protein n=1 Tax=Micromonospora sp. DT228 TaxID=3393443 RepID=UPI003CEFB75F
MACGGLGAAAGDTGCDPTERAGGLLGHCRVAGGVGCGIVGGSEGNGGSSAEGRSQPPVSTPAHGSTGVWCSGDPIGIGAGGVGSADSPHTGRRGSGGGTGAEPLHLGAGASGVVAGSDRPEAAG